MASERSPCLGTVGLTCGRRGGSTSTTTCLQWVTGQRVLYPHHARHGAAVCGACGSGEAKEQRNCMCARAVRARRLPWDGKNM